MPNRPWLDELRARLAKRGLPPNYVQRFAEELSDHLEDFKEENMGTEVDVYSRLGKPEQVAEAAVTAYRRRSFLGRHPAAAFLVFGLSPIVPQLMLGYVACLPLAAAFQVLIGVGAFSTNGLQAFAGEAWSCALSLLIGTCSALASLLYGELAVRFGLGKKWTIVSCTVLALMAVWWERGIHDSGFCGIHDGIRFHPVVLAVQFIVPFAVGWRFVQQGRGKHYPVTTFFVFAVSPLVSLVVLWCIAFLALCFAQKLLGFPCVFNEEHFGPVALAAWASGFTVLMSVIPSSLASVLYCKLAKRLGLGRKWMLVSCAAVATVAAMYCFRVVPYTNDSGKHIGISDGLGIYSLAQLLQFLVPLAIGWWFMRRTRDQGRLEMAS